MSSSDSGKRQLAILGSTGSIGTQTLDVVSQFPSTFSVYALSGGRNISLLQEQVIAHQPSIVCVAHSKDESAMREFVSDNGLQTDVVVGQAGLVEICQNETLDLVVVSIVGTASLRPTVAAIKSGITIALACKEVLVAAGDLIMPMAKAAGVPILPIDSEHAAIKQCLAGVAEDPKAIDRLILTASGGPFWQKDASEFRSITKAMALKHPSWTMGSKITIDSATMMNKGLEVIEAHHLFNIPYDAIDVVIHPHSIVHSLVSFSDHTMLAQMGLPDMRFPIQYALTYPEKLKNPWPKTDLTQLPPLTFHPPDFDKFPLLRLAYESGKKGGDYPMFLNAANEVAVHQFLTDQIDFYEIPAQVEASLAKATGQPFSSIETIIEQDMAIKKAGGLTYE